MESKHSNLTPPDAMILYCQDRIRRIREELDLLRDLIAYLEGRQDGALPRRDTMP